MNKRNERKSLTLREVVIYVLSIVIFVLLASTFDKVTRTTTSSLSDEDNANTQWVLNEIESNPLRGEGALEICLAVATEAERTKTGFPFVLYETAKTVPCGESSGRTEPDRRKNQFLNTATAAVLALGLGATAMKVTKKND